MEHILVSNIMQHLDSNKILYAHQHGFRIFLSCDTRLLPLFQDLSSNPSQTDMIRSHVDVYNCKLNWYGIRGTTHTWIQHFRQGRSQRVVSEGSQSSSHNVLSGVPPKYCYCPHTTSTTSPTKLSIVGETGLVGTLFTCSQMSPKIFTIEISI